MSKENSPASRLTRAGRAGRAGLTGRAALTALTVLTALAVFTSACGSTAHEAGAGRVEITPAPATRQPTAARIVALGDLHGDLAATRRALRLAGAIDASDRWIGRDLVVVQTGDQLDRGDDERAILHLLDRLGQEAAAAGGAVHALNGNHELMNAHLDFRYVTEGGFGDFQGSRHGVTVDTAAPDSLLASYPPEQRGRVAAFRPGGPYARLLAGRNTVVMVGDNVFLHGGLLPAHAAYGIEAINEEIRTWLRGETPAPATSRGADSPIWVRTYSRDVDAAACATLAETLRLLRARRMIVGHTVQGEGIRSYCDGAVWAVDVGMSAHYGGPTEVLEIRGDQVRALRAQGGGDGAVGAGGGTP